MNRNSNSTYTSKGAIEHTAKAKPSYFSGIVRKRNHKSLVEHSHPLLLSELDELDELIEMYPNLIVEHRILHRASETGCRKTAKDLMCERTDYPTGWKDATKCAAQYGKHKEFPVPRRETTQKVKKKKNRRIDNDTVYYTDTARAQYIAPLYGLGDVEEPNDAYVRTEIKKSKKDKFIA